MAQNESQMSVDIVKMSPIAPSPVIPTVKIVEGAGARTWTAGRDTPDKPSATFRTKAHTSATALIQAQQVSACNFLNFNFNYFW